VTMALHFYVSSLIPWHLILGRRWTGRE
jgi:hypothetical protein